MDHKNLKKNGKNRVPEPDHLDHYLQLVRVLYRSKQRPSCAGRRVMIYDLLALLHTLL